MDIKVAVTITLAFLGWLIAHHFSSKRDMVNKRRDLRISYLLEAYRKLESAAQAKDIKSKWPAIESAVADIQLLGTPLQVELARQFANGISENGFATLDDLLFDLRESLRSELSLEKIDLSIIHLRFNENT